MIEKAYFTIEEVAAVLRSGSDDKNNSLIIDFTGNVRLVPFTGDRDDYAVRFETFIAGNGYVGPNSKLNHLEGTYQALLEGWVDYLRMKNKTIGIYRDYAVYEKSIEELKEEAKRLFDLL